MFPLKAVVEESGSWLVGVWGWKFLRGLNIRRQSTAVFFFAIKNTSVTLLSLRSEGPGEVRGRIRNFPWWPDPNDSQPAANFPPLATEA